MNNHVRSGRRVGILLLSLLLGGLILNLFMQAASLNMEISSIFNWISEYPLLYIVGSLFFFFILLGFAAIVPNLYTGALIAFVVCIILGIADYEKLSTTGEPLFPWDLMQLKNASEMARITKGMISPLQIGIAILVLALLIFVLLKLPKVRLRLTLRIIVLAVSVFVVAGFISTVSGGRALATSLHYQNIFWNQKVNYKQNGFVFAFAGNLKQNLIDKPEGYSKEEIQRITAKYAALPDSSAASVGAKTSGGTAGSTTAATPPAPANDAAASAAAEGTKAAPMAQPNILFMMDEAFFDPTRLSAYTFSSDPLTFIHQQEKVTPSGYLLSPEFGGNTANVEFEALTGFSMYFLKDGSIPYQQRIVKMSSLPSIVSLLKERGYEALALHPYDKTFYNRNKVYTTLGFEQFTSQSEMPDPERMTPDGYISDKSAVKEAIRELKAADKPAFLHLITMQNHFPFTKGPNGPNTITVEGVDKQYQDELETYTQDTKLTDEALQYLSEQLKTIERPTLVVFWGDHLPALSTGIYTKTGWDTDPRLKHETKLIYMANFDIGSTPLGTMSPSFIGPTVFKLTGQAMPAYYKLLEQVKAQLPGLSKSVLVGSDGTEIEASALTEEQQSLLSDYRMVEYDLLEGKGYAADLMFK